MKKVLVLFLLIVLVYNSIGFIINFQFVLTEWRQEMKHFLSKPTDEKKLTRFVFHKNNFDLSTQEFSKNNFRYDVVKIETHGDSLIVFAFRDDKETNLAENFSDELFQNTSQNTFQNNFSENNFSKNNFQKKIKNNFQKNFLKEFFFEKIFFEKKNSKLIFREKKFFCYTEIFFPKIFPDIIAAPPEV